MTRFSYSRFVCLAALCSLALGTQAQVPSQPDAIAASQRTRQANVLATYSNLPLAFERRSSSQFITRGQGYAITLSGTQTRINLGQSKNIDMEFVGGRFNSAQPGKKLPGRINYISGNDPEQWQTDVPTYDRVIYTDVYQGIDVAFYGNRQHLEFDVVLKPGADARSVIIRFRGAGKLLLDSNGSLAIGDLQLLVPTVIQDKRPIRARYRLIGNDQVAFDLGDYDRRQSLTIDPTLVYSTRLGGGTGANLGVAIAVDADGNSYIAGTTLAADFPVANGNGFSGNQDGFISKVDPTGTLLIYSTYIGGAGTDWFRGIAVDASGQAWTVGYTTSPDFPLLSPFQSGYAGIADGVVVKLSASGTLVYSSFLGGPQADTANSVAVDAAGNAYVTGQAGVGFPTTTGVYAPNNMGGSDAFVTKFTPGGTLSWSTFVGGTDFDYATGIAIDNGGNAYITGETFSTGFPNAPPGGAQVTNRNNGDAFVAKLAANGTSLLYFTFMGGAGEDTALSIAVDRTSGIAVIVGGTTSTDLTTSGGVIQPSNAGGYDGFVAKLNAAGSAFLYTSYFGGNRRDFLSAVAIDSAGNAYVAGSSDSTTLPMNASIQPNLQGNSTSLFRTTNGGGAWTAFDTSLPGAATGLSPDPTNANILIASTDNGTYRTTNGGIAWTQQTPIANMTLSRSPATPSTIYGTTSSLVYQSIDNGVTWVFKGSLPSCCGGIVADPTSASVAYVFNIFSPSLPGVQKTVDNGATWTAAVTGLPANVLVTAIVAGSDGALYAGLANSPGGLFKSTNQGNTWVAINSGLNPGIPIPPQGLVVSPTNPSLLYVTDYFTLYKTINGGLNWTTVGTLPGGTSALGISSTISSTLFYSAYDSSSQMWVSTDSGATWNPSSGTGVASTNGIVPDPINGAGAYGLASVHTLPFVAKVDAAGQNLLYSTYLGDSGSASGIATDGMGNSFVTGSTLVFPTTPSALQRNRDSNQNNQDAFVARISDATDVCSYSLDPPQSVELWFPHLIPYVVTAPSGCSWTASSDQPWATISSGASGIGSGIVYVLVANDITPGIRSANISIGDQTISLQQRPGSCGYNAFTPTSSSIPAAGGTVQFGLTVASGCPWTISNAYPWAVAVLAGRSGIGNGSVTLSVAPNTSTLARTFNVTSPQGGTQTITQAGGGQPPKSPTLTGIAPASGVVGTSFFATITGTNLLGVTAVTFSGAGVSAAIGSGGTALSLPITVTILPNAALGPRTVTVTTFAGTSVPQPFTVLALPLISSISPAAGVPATNFAATISGSNLSGATAVTFSGTGVTAVIGIGGTATSLPVTITILSTAAAGNRTVTVNTLAGPSNPFTFAVVPLPVLSSISPPVGLTGTIFGATIAGAHLIGASAVNFSGNGVTAAIVNGGTDTLLPITITVTNSASLGNLTVTVANIVGSSNSLPFTVVQASHSYSYDAIGQLTKVVDSTGTTVQYVYDAAGNPVQILRTP